MFEHQTVIDQDYMYEQNESLVRLISWLEQQVGTRGREWMVYGAHKHYYRIGVHVMVFEFASKRHQLMFEMVWSHAIRIPTCDPVDTTEL